MATKSSSKIAPKQPVSFFHLLHDASELSSKPDAFADYFYAQNPSVIPPKKSHLRITHAHTALGAHVMGLLNDLLHSTFVNRNGVPYNFLGPLNASSRTATKTLPPNTIDPKTAAIAPKDLLVAGLWFLMHSRVSEDRAFDRMGYYLLHTAGQRGASLSHLKEQDKRKILHGMRQLTTLFSGTTPIFLSFKLSDEEHSSYTKYKTMNDAGKLSFDTLLHLVHQQKNEGLQKLLVSLGYKESAAVQQELINQVCLKFLRSMEEQASGYYSQIEMSAKNEKMLQQFLRTQKDQEVRPHPLAVLLHALPCAKKTQDATRMYGLIELAIEHQWHKSYKGIHPFSLLIQSLSHHNGSNAGFFPKTLALLIENGFDAQGGGPTPHKMGKGLTEPILMAAARMVRPNPTEMFATIKLLVSAGADPKAVNKTGKNLLGVLNQEAGAASTEVRAKIEEMFAFFMEQGLDPMSIVPQKEALSLAKTTGIRQLIQTHLDKMMLLSVLDQDILTEAVEIAKKLKEERAAKIPKGAPRRL